VMRVSSEVTTSEATDGRNAGIRRAAFAGH
jgi:hypothetical protein